MSSHESALPSPAESFPPPSMRLCPVKPLQRLSAGSMATVEYLRTRFQGMRACHPFANHSNTAEPDTYSHNLASLILAHFYVCAAEYLHTDARSSSPQDRPQRKKMRSSLEMVTAAMIFSGRSRPAWRVRGDAQPAIPRRRRPAEPYEHNLDLASAPNSTNTRMSTLRELFTDILLEILSDPI
jgi:hypothetical protein